MVAWKALAALAIVVGGAAAAFAVYTFGWREGGSDRKTPGVSAKAGRHVYTLRDGDVVLRPEAATRCEASGEGGRPDLFCTRMHGGRHQVIFYKDVVLVWPLDCRTCGPDGPVFDYRWEPKRSRSAHQRASAGQPPVASLVVSSAATPRFRVPRYDTSGTYPQVRGGDLDLGLADLHGFESFTTTSSSLAGTPVARALP